MKPRHTLYVLSSVLALSCGKLQLEIFPSKVWHRISKQTKKTMLTADLTWFICSSSLTKSTLFPDCSTGEIYQKVYAEKVMEPLPPDCPKDLSELIDACRSFEPFQRPTAGGNINGQIKKYMLVCRPSQVKGWRDQFKLDFIQAVACRMLTKKI